MNKSLRALLFKVYSMRTRLRKLADTEGKWVTVRGRRIFIGKGEDFESALNRSLKGEGSKGSNDRKSRSEFSGDKESAQNERKQKVDRYVKDGWKVTNQDAWTTELERTRGNELGKRLISVTNVSSQHGPNDFRVKDIDSTTTKQAKNKRDAENKAVKKRVGKWMRGPFSPYD